MLCNPELYNEFSKERQQPFKDLLPLINIKNSMNVVDLGCGTGELTKELGAMQPCSGLIITVAF
ncbi:MAG: hypothetical protein Q8936_12775 [Bacillota bacterium]|nr:hypothetical protein [Bacillota bacterium]